jgi:hypothetical protein
MRSSALERRDLLTTLIPAFARLPPERGGSISAEFDAVDQSRPRGREPAPPSVIVKEKIVGEVVSTRARRSLSTEGGWVSRELHVFPPPMIRLSLFRFPKFHASFHSARRSVGSAETSKKPQSQISKRFASFHLAIATLSRKQRNRSLLFLRNIARMSAS